LQACSRLADTDADVVAQELLDARADAQAIEELGGIEPECLLY